MEDKKVGIVIPAYNEEKRIRKTLEDYVDFFQGKEKYEILIVLNGCKDNTLGIVEEYSKKYKLINYLDFKTAGKGFAIEEGFKYCLAKEFDLIGFVDADGATPAKEFYALIKKIGAAGGIIGNRWDKKSILLSKQTFSRRVMSRSFNFMVRVLFLMNIKDTQCGAKLFRKEVVEKIIKEIKISEWAIDVNLLYIAKRKGYSIKEIPTLWAEPGGSKVNSLKTSIRMLLAILRLRIIYSPFEKISKPLKPFVRMIYALTK